MSVLWCQSRFYSLNNRNVSNLPYLAKLLKKSALEHLNGYFKADNLHEPFQSAYKSLNSTETAIIRIMHDVVIDMDGRKVIFIALLDLSAAFDTVDHDILLNCLHRSNNVDGKTLEWIRSNLSGRTQHVAAHGKNQYPCWYRVASRKGMNAPVLSHSFFYETRPFFVNFLSFFSYLSIHISIQWSIIVFMIAL